MKEFTVISVTFLLQRLNVSRLLEYLREYLVALKKAECFWSGTMELSTLSTDTASQLDVFGHDGDTLGVDGAEVSVLKQTNQVSLACLLKGHDGRALESQIGLEILSDLTDQTLEGKLADQKLSGLLVSPDLTESHGTRSVPVWLLHTPSSGSRLASSFSSQLLPGSFSSGGFTCGLLGTSHGDLVMVARTLQCYLYTLCPGEKEEE